MKKVYVYTGMSESGDVYGPWVFEKKPTPMKLSQILRNDCAGEFTEHADGPGIFGSFIHLKGPYATEVIS